MKTIKKLAWGSRPTRAHILMRMCAHTHAHTHTAQLAISQENSQCPASPSSSKSALQLNLQPARLRAGMSTHARRADRKGCLPGGCQRQLGEQEVEHSKAEATFESISGRTRSQRGPGSTIHKEAFLKVNSHPLSWSTRTSRLGVKVYSCQEEKTAATDRKYLRVRCGWPGARQGVQLSISSSRLQVTLGTSSVLHSAQSANQDLLVSKNRLLSFEFSWGNETFP